MGPHAASLGMRFYTGSMFPKSYKNVIIVARHGSWNRSKKFGGDVVVVKLNKDGTVKSIEPLLTGFLENNKYVGRPVDVMQMKDGSLLVSDDWNGAVYRITYGKPKVARSSNQLANRRTRHAGVQGIQLAPSDTDTCLPHLAMTKDRMISGIADA